MKKSLFILMLTLLLIFTASCAQQPVKGEASSISKMGDIKRVKVTADTANVRTGCSNDTPVIQTSNKNQTFDVINKVADWYAVKLPDNQIGFVSERQCKPIVAEDKKAQMQPETPETAPGTTPEATPGTPTGTDPGADTGTKPTTPSEDTNAGTLTSQEQEMLSLVNQARSQNKVTPLKLDMELTKVARIKSQDMIDNNYFSHNSPTYGSPFDMMKKFGINYVRAGENIAGNQNVQKAHDTLMNSPGHRKNILSPDFTHIGIGIKRGGPYGNMFTQMFISKPQ
ncbi:MAG: CAP domain-containing protein [Firmicutes bacterium]|nr:CAP domain-containing protein [Bacillota bacterium]